MRCFFKNEQSSSLYNTGLLKQFVKINVFSDKAFGFIEHGLQQAVSCCFRESFFVLFILVIYMIVS